MPNRSAFTLVELLVVLVVLGLASALVAPGLIFPEPADTPPVDRLLRGAVDLAGAREQTVELVVDDGGAWRIEAGAPAETLERGRLDYDGPPFALSVSPLGTCGARPGLDPPFAFDPLTCEPR